MADVRVTISSMLDVLEDVADTVGILMDDNDEIGIKLYMEGLEYKLGFLRESEVIVETDERFENLPNLNRYIRIIDDINDLSKNGMMSSIIGLVVEYVENFIYGGMV